MDIMKQFRMDRQKGLYYRRRQGIGKAIAEAFIQAGAEFTIVDVNMEKAQAVAQAFRNNMESISPHSAAMFPTRSRLPKWPIW